jgi:hypothetical protein
MERTLPTSTTKMTEVEAYFHARGAYDLDDLIPDDWPSEKRQKLLDGDSLVRDEFDDYVYAKLISDSVRVDYSWEII